MQLVVVGVNQEAAPVALRERLAFAAADLPDALAALREVVAEGCILSTCNRTEIVGLAGHAESGAESLARFLAESRGVSLAEIRPHLRTFAHEAAVEHLFTVAAGLDSMVLGEDQILAQVKAAFDSAAAAGALGPALHRLGDLALAAGKRVRAETVIGQGNLSVVSVALRLALTELGAWQERAVLLIGGGDIAELALKHLAKGRPAAITIVNRTYERAAALAARYDADARSWAELPAALVSADVAVSCTSAPGIVLDAPALARALAARPDRPLLCLDLAVPRDIAPAARNLPGVTLHDVDALQALADEGWRQRAAAIAPARAIIAAETARYMDWWRAREVAPAIAALRGHADAIREAEVARALARLPALTPREAEVVRALAAGIVNKLLHRPIMALKTAPEGANMAVTLQELFGLPASPPAISSRHAEDAYAALTAPATVPAPQSRVTHDSRLTTHD
ncbi:MAG: glutamyl-tRNA reductase [Thermomicrobiales bacterium]